MEEKEALTNNNNQTIENENANMEPAAKVSELGKAVFGEDDTSKTHEQEVADCPEGTPEEIAELSNTLKKVAKMAELSSAENYPKPNKETGAFLDAQKTKIKTPKKQQVKEQQSTRQNENDIERTL